MNRIGKIVMGAGCGLLGLIGVSWLGLQFPSRLLSLPAGSTGQGNQVPVPAGLPPPVARYLRAVAGDEIEAVESLAVCGHGRARLGIWLPLRYRLVHRPGSDFERYMEVTWFGLPILKAVDRYLDGVGMTGPLGAAATGPAIDQAANMILWVEGPLMPSLWITDARIRWEAIDDQTARLHFPFQNEEDECVVHFDVETHLVQRITALRHRDEKSGKIPWQVDFLAWRRFDSTLLPSSVAVTWTDQGKPWSYWEMDEVVSNLRADSKSAS